MFFLLSLGSMTRLLLLIFFLGYTYTATSQNYADKTYYLIDSLSLDDLSKNSKQSLEAALKLFHKAAQDTVKVEILKKLINNRSETNIKYSYSKWLRHFIYTKLKQHNKPFELKQKAPIHKSLLNSYSWSLSNLGIINYKYGRIEKALIYYDSTLVIRKKTFDTLGIANAHSNKALLYMDLEQTQNALDQLQKSLTLHRKIKNEKGLANILNNIGVLFSDQVSNKEALKYYKESYSLFKKQNNKFGISATLTNIADVYKTQGEYNKSLEYLQESLKIKNEGNILSGISDIISTKGEIEQLKKNYDKALDYFKQSLTIAKENKNKKDIAIYSINIGETYFLKKNIEKGIRNTKQGLVLAEELENPKIIEKGCSILERIYTEEKNWKEAYTYSKRAFKIRESLKKVEVIKDAARLNTNFEIEKREQEISILKKGKEIRELKLSSNRLLIAVLVIIILFAISLSYLIYNIYRKRQLKNKYLFNKKIRKLESKAMRSQMNPHFIFNALNSMQSVMILKGEKAANKYFMAFSKLLRITLDISNSEKVSIKNEISYLKYYLELENLRLNNRINVIFNIDEKLIDSKKKIPCMLFQPIIENAIIHGFASKKDNLELTINFKTKKRLLIAEFIDNGIGREQAAINKKKRATTHKSWATHILNERIEIFNSLNVTKIKFNIIDLKDTNNAALGTKVSFKIPLIKNTL